MNRNQRRLGKGQLSSIQAAIRSLPGFRRLRRRKAPATDTSHRPWNAAPAAKNGRLSSYVDHHPLISAALVNYLIGQFYVAAWRADCFTRIQDAGAIL